MAQAEYNEEQSDFNKIIEKVGNAGLFQKRFNVIFNCLLSFLLCMPYTNLIISLAVPIHWCYVPGREYTNYSIEQWKHLTIPMEIGAHGNLAFSKCTRFANVSGINTLIRNNDGIVKCNQGWEYDHTWYDLTAPMQNDWVCDNALVPSNTMAVSRVGEVIGSLIFGHLGDNFGRKPIFFITLITCIFGRLMSAFTSPWVYLFLIASFIGSLCSSVVFNGPSVIMVEIVRPEDRAHIGLMGFFAWSLGMTVLPLCMWALGDWVYFMLVTTIPSAIFFFTQSCFVESPRLLISKGDIKKCVKELEKIAKTNKTEVPNDLEVQLTKINKQQNNSKAHTAMSLFSSVRLMKNTFILIYCMSTILTIFMCLVINVGSMSGNPFVQYISQALAQLPSFFVGKWLCNSFGRRWGLFTGFFLGTLGCFVAFIFVQDDSNYLIVRIVCIFTKFSISISMFTITIMNMEIYPTCIRQTGTSVGNIIGNLFSILAPYIIALGVSVNALIPFGLYSVALVIAGMLCLFLPETRGVQLPDTLQDAAVFGANQDMWGRNKTQKIANNT